MQERMLVFRPGALGDALLAAPALRALRRTFPAVHSEFIGHREAGRLLAAASVIDQAVGFDDAEVLPLFLDPPRVPERWQGQSLVVVWMHRGHEIARAFKRAGAREVVLRSPNGAAVHMAEHLVATLAGVGVVSTSTDFTQPLVFGGSGGDLTFHSMGSAQASPHPGSPHPGSPHPGSPHPGSPHPGSPHPASPHPDGTDLLLVHPGSGAARKDWGSANFSRLILEVRRAGWRVEVVEGPADEEAVRGLQDALGVGRLDVVRPESLQTLADQLLRARVYVGNDSGVTHLAGLLGARTLAIFGATDPRRWAPLGPQVRIAGEMNRWPSVEEVRRTATDWLG